MYECHPIAIPGVNREGVIFRIEADYEDINAGRSRLFVSGCSRSSTDPGRGHTQQYVHPFVEIVGRSAYRPTQAHVTTESVTQTTEQQQQQVLVGGVSFRGTGEPRGWSDPDLLFVQLAYAMDVGPR